MYLATQTHADISYTISYLARFVANPSRKHIVAAKQLLRYLAGTDASIKYTFGKRLEQEESRLQLKAYSNSDWAGCHNTRRSTSGYIVMAGGSPISWQSAQQRLVALLSCEAKYYGVAEAVKEAL